MAALRVTSLLALTALLTAATGVARGPDSPEGTGTIRDSSPVTLLATSGGDAREVRVTLTFSRRVDYRLEETRNRLRVLLEVPLDEQNSADIDLGGEILRRIRFDSGKRSSQVVFHTGPGFAAFDLAEEDSPFRLLVVFRAEGVEANPLAATAPEGRGPESAAGPEPSPGSAPEGLDDLAAADIPAPLPAHDPDEVRNIVLDPGHGGEEEGAIGPSGLKEKDLVLDIARRLRQVLASSGYNVALTREEDRPVGLTARTSLANYLAADLFISIHANASSRRGAFGTESYFLAWDTGETGEAADDSLEAAAPGRGKADAPDEPLAAILWEMAQVRHLGDSSRLAGLMQEELNRATSVRNRGVKQAPFRVLVGARMPSILVEVGFLSEPAEEANLRSDEYRDRLVTAMAAAIDRFRTAVARDAKGGTPSTLESASPR